MEADRTNIGGIGANDDMAAVAALPDADATLVEDLGCLDVAQQGTISLLMMLLDGCHAPELLGQLMETLLVSLAGKGGVHAGPLIVLAVCSM